MAPPEMARVMVTIGCSPTNEIATRLISTHHRTTSIVRNRNGWSLKANHEDLKGTLFIFILESVARFAAVVVEHFYGVEGIV